MSTRCTNDSKKEYAKLSTNEEESVRSYAGYDYGPPYGGGGHPGYPPDPGYHHDGPPPPPEPGFQQGYPPAADPGFHHGYPEPGRGPGGPIPPPVPHALIGPSVPYGGGFGDYILDILLDLNEVLVLQQVEWLEIMVGFETANRYKICDLSGRTLLYAVEKSDCCDRQFCGSTRGFTISFLDQSGQTKFSYTRPQNCTCCADSGTVILNAQIIGNVQQQCSCADFKLDVVVGRTGERYTVDGGMCGGCCRLCRMCSDHNYPVLHNGVRVGCITKQFSGMMKELFTDADNFKVSFPHNCSLEARLTLIATTIQIDFMMYENNEHNGAKAI